MTKPTDQTAINADIELLRKLDLLSLPVKFHPTELLTDLAASLQNIDAAKRELTMRYEMPEHTRNGFDVVHGGLLSTLLDQTMVNTLILADKELLGSATINLSVNFITSFRPGPIAVIARPVTIGNRVAQLSAECFCEKQKHLLVATGTASMLLRRKRK